MVSKKFVVRHDGGMDANHAAQLVRLANQYDCNVHVALGARTGDEIVIIANGPDEEYALNALEEYLDRQ